MVESLLFNQTTEAVLTHLKLVKPFDGWTIEVYHTGSDQRKLLRLCRRGAPLTNHGFSEIFFDKDGSGCIVGISDTDSAKGLVIVEADGSVARVNREIFVTRHSIIRTASDGVNSVLERARQERQRRRDERQNQKPEVATPCLTDEQNKRLLQVTGVVFLVLALLKIIFSTLFKLSILLLPVLLYASQNVPSNESFDAKKELKRVLRGHHLSEDDPRKPKGWLEETIAKVQASVTTELSTSFGYEIEMTNILNFATLAHTRVPAAKVDCYWIGIFGKWHYLTMRNIPERQKED